MLDCFSFAYKGVTSCESGPSPDWNAGFLQKGKSGRKLKNGYIRKVTQCMYCLSPAPGSSSALIAV